MKRTLLCVLAALLVLLACAASNAAPNITGLSGILEIPDDTVVAPGAVSLGYHGVFHNGTTNWFTGTAGIVPNLEVGIGVRTDGGSDVAINGKYRILAETVDRPAITVGVVDAAESIGDNPGLFLLISKTLTSAAEDVTGEPSKPLRGHVGIGGGLFKGLMAGLTWTLSPKLQAAVEYAKFAGDHDFNGLLRYALTSDLRLDVGALKFSHMVLGLSYTSRRF